MLFSCVFSAVFAPFLTGIGGTVLFGRSLRCRGARGLLFHSLLPDTLSLSLSLSSIPSLRFRSIVRYVKDISCASATVGEACRTSGTAEPPAESMLFTFDDGCRSFYTQALPVLEEFGIKATIFPVAGYLGRTSTWDILPVFSHLTRSELREIDALGHEIGSHGMNHTDLTLLGDQDLRSELLDSKKTLEDLLGKKVAAISFPFGSWNRRVWREAQECGYGCGTVCRRHSSALSGLFPVYGVYNFDTPLTVASRVAPHRSPSVSIACATIMSHFAKGAPLWKFDKRYRLSGNDKRSAF